jgi:hypothetical protein
VTASAPDSLAIELLVRAEVGAGEPVHFVLRIANRGPRPVDLYLRGRALTLDLEVTRASGEVVWRRLAGAIIPAIVHLRTLAPGERLEVAADWDQRTARWAVAGTGEYRARGLLLVEGEPLASPWVGFRISAP